jgi:hypothetical protein
MKNKRTPFPGVVLPLLVVAAVNVNAADFVIRPYLQNPGPTRMTLMWTSRGAGGWTVRYAPKAGGKTALFSKIISNRPDSETPASWLSTGRGEMQQETVHEARLTGLAPGTEYRYEVASGKVQAVGMFRTPAENRASFTFAVYGDSRSFPERHRRVAGAMREARPAFILHTGDLVKSGRYGEYRPQFFDPLADLIDHVPIWPAPGNHEGNRKAYKLLFHLPRDELFYSFDYGNVHVVSIDSDVPEGETGRMLAWLAADLGASSARWKIAFFHYPVYDLGGHRSKWGRDSVAPLFRKHGVDFVFCGHSHGYQRFHPMYTEGENEDHPVTYVVTGGGGARLYPVTSAPEAAVVDSVHHYVLMTVSGNRIEGRVLTPEGRQIDAFVMTKDDRGRLDAKTLASAVSEGGFNY